VKAYVYVVAAAGTDPRTIKCPVPWPVDEQEIFFGACKKQMRREFRQRFLVRGLTDAIPDEELWLIGLYPPLDDRARNVLFAGKVTRVMTFARAYESLTADRYSDMRRGLRADMRGVSPLHLKPIYEAKNLIGYEHRLLMHRAKRAWASDVAPKNSSRIEIDGRRVLVRKGLSAREAFTLDATLVLETLFWGPQHAVLQVDADAVDIFQRAQPRAGVTARNPLGTTSSGAADGKRGRYLPLEDRLAGNLVDWIRQHAR
jgi:hypothetical protein